MSYVPCRGCIEKGRQPPCYVPDVNQACCDCGLPTPQERERELDRLRTSLDRAHSTQRDRFAEAAIAAGKAPNEAWDTADTMMELREKSHRERHTPAPHKCAADPNSCFKCGKLLVLCVDCPECGAEPGQSCKTENGWGFHPARFAVVEKSP